MQLADFQDAFARALLASDPRSAAPGLAQLVTQPGFAVYRNTVLKGCIDALQANFPAVARLVGDEWFRAAAAVYVRRELPSTPTLLTYGQTFAEFLATFGPAGELPYLGDVARVDRLWSEAHEAADDEVLAPSALSRLAPGDMTRLGLRLHAAAHWTWCDAHPVYALWSRNREPDADVDSEVAWCGEGVLLTRPHGAVQARPLTHDGAAFLAACAAGLSIEHAVMAALEADPQSNVAELISTFLQAGALAALQPTTTTG